jgi:3-deoxy-D-manno-octulosonate 8-phosphate phosphatase (KDO 8-P phosphatase)
MADLKIEKLKNIRLVVSDVDGVLTDGGMYFSETGLELKKFDVKDGMGFVLLKRSGIETGIITTDTSKIIDVRAKRFDPTFLISGTWEKLTALHSKLSDLNITLEETAYIGDDINDLEILKEVGFSASPADAVSSVKNIVDYVCTSQGGRGAFRELAELVINFSQYSRKAT